MQQENILTTNQLNKAISRKIENAPTKTDAKNLIKKAKSRVVLGLILTSLSLAAVWKMSSVNIYVSFLLFFASLYGVFYCLVLIYYVKIAKNAYAGKYGNMNF